MTRRPTDGWAAWKSRRDRPLLAPTDVVAALSELGVEMIRQIEDEVTIRCPAHLRITGHEDRHPSCSVNSITGMVNCLSCHWGGSFFTVVREMRPNWTSDDIESWITERTHGAAAAVLGIRQELEQHRDIIEVGESDLALYDHVPDEFAAKRGLDPECLVRYGVRWDTEKQHWIIPVRNARTGRLLGWQIKGETKRLFKNYPPDMEKSAAVFGSNLYTPRYPAIVVESPLDSVRLASVGIYGSVAVFGSRISDLQATWLTSCASSIILALDNDAAGRTGTKEFLQQHTHRVSIFNYSYTSAKDVGDMSPEAIRLGVEHAIWHAQWKPDGTSAKFGHRTVSRGA